MHTINSVSAVSTPLPLPLVSDTYIVISMARSLGLAYKHHVSSSGAPDEYKPFY